MVCDIASPLTSVGFILTDPNSRIIHPNNLLKVFHLSPKIEDAIWQTNGFDPATYGDPYLQEIRKLGCHCKNQAKCGYQLGKNWILPASFWFEQQSSLHFLLAHCWIRVFPWNQLLFNSKKLTCRPVCSQKGNSVWSPVVLTSHLNELRGLSSTSGLKTTK